MRLRVKLFTAALAVLASACSSHGEGADAGLDAGPPVPELVDAGIFVRGVGVANTDCRAAICQHNENTDLVRFGGAIYLVHRTAQSQILGPDSALHVYRSTDEGASFQETSTILAPEERFPGEAFPDGGTVDFDGGRDLRDPSFYEVDGVLHLKALTRLPVTSYRDSNVDTLAVESHSRDGATWSPLAPIGPPGWSFWRVKAQGGAFYSAAYEDGDRRVVLFRSTDGVTWTAGATIYDDAAMTPLETELTFMPSGRLLALVRTDGDDAHILGDSDLQTQPCWAEPPYDAFHCDAPLVGVRLDGPLSFFWQGRLFVVARKHLGRSDKKRTAVYEVTGELEGGPIAVEERLELPSAGDTSYAGGVALADGRMLLSWYSGDLTADEAWFLGMFDATDIWLGTIDLRAP